MCICILYPVSCMNCISYSVYNCILYHTITIATQCIPVSRIDCILFLYWHYKNCGQWWKSCHWRILFQTHILNIKQDGFTHIWKNVMIFFFTVLYCTAHCTVLYCTCSSQAAPSRYRPVSPVPSAGTSSPVCTDHYRDTALLLPSSGQSEDKRKVTKSPGDPVYFGLLYYCISGFNAGKG